MKTFPALYNVQKNLKTGASPVWILKILVAGVFYYISDNAFSIGPWGVTTKRWAKAWGSLTEGISGSVDEFKISDFTVTCLADPDDSPNIVDLALANNLEVNLCYLYAWYHGCADPPQEFFRGYIRDYPITEGDTVCSLQIQDETLKWARTYVGKKITVQDHPFADLDDVGKIEPIVFGSVSKLPALAVDAGVQTNLANALNATTTSVVLSDIRGLSAGMLLQVDSEQMQIVSVPSNTLTVIRGANGTLADIHQRGAVVWQQKANFYYIVAGHAVDSIPKAYAVVGQVTLDISTLCTVWPAGNHPSYPGKAVISVPGYITIEQAVNLAIADGLVISNGSLVAGLTGNVTRTGSASLSGSADLSGNVGYSGSVALSGAVALVGALFDPGHTHLTGQSSNQGTTVGLPTSPTGYTYNTTVYPSGYGINVYGAGLSFPSDGARSDATYSVTIKFALTVAQINGPVYIYACINGNQIMYSYPYSSSGGIVANNSTFSFTFSTGSNQVNSIYVMCAALGYGYLQVTAATRTIQLTGLVSGGNSASVNNGSLTAGNGNLGTTNSIVVGNGTLAVANTLGVSDLIAVDKGTLAASLGGNISKTGTVALAGNSVANTLVGDKILVNVTRSIAGPGAAVQELLAGWCNVPSFRQVGAFPASYAFNGAITDYRLALDQIHDLAWQCRAWFRHSLGEGVLTVRTLSPVSVKTLPWCRVEGGKKLHSRDKTPYDEIINVINLLYGRDWTQARSAKAYTAVSPGTNAQSIDDFGKQELPDLFMCDFIAGQEMADDVQAFYLAYHSVRHWLHTHSSFYYDSELEFADGVTLGFAGGIVGQIQEAGFNPGSDTIQLKVIQ